MEWFLCVNITAGLLWGGGTSQVGDSGQGLCQTQEGQTAAQRTQVEQQEAWTPQESLSGDGEEKQEEPECFGSAAC